MPAWKRDPLSELLDAGARRLLSDVYAAKGGWIQTRLADPGEAARAVAAGYGIDPDGPDRPSAAGGRGLDARTRWGRAFARALWYQHRWYGTARTRGGPALREEKRAVPYERPLEVEFGRRVRAVGVIPAGRLVRVRLRPGGSTGRRAVQKKPDSARIYDDAGDIAARHSDPLRRDWEG